MALRTIADIDAAGAALAATWPPPSQELVNRAAALLAPHQPALPLPRPQDARRAQPASSAA